MKINLEFEILIKSKFHHKKIVAKGDIYECNQHSVLGSAKLH